MATATSSPWHRRSRPPLVDPRPPEDPPCRPLHPRSRNRAGALSINGEIVDSASNSDKQFVDSGHPRPPPAKPGTPTASSCSAAPSTPSRFFWFVPRRRIHLRPKLRSAMAFIPEFRLVCFKISGRHTSVYVEAVHTQNHQAAKLIHTGFGPDPLPEQPVSPCAHLLPVAACRPDSAQNGAAFAFSRIGSRSGVVRYAKFSGCPSASFNRYEDMFDEDDASKVTLPALPG
nr:uncharacterized protein LOC127305163 isoform X2 [Lolium perenne]XP_051191500.1 uncharacterized protein LOC127305163 isoform X3 [Lolium perenne]XP_051191501.1 uncharacterized protein LOC127305163 isoform X4 [Lolium perenne]